MAQGWAGWSWRTWNSNLLPKKGAKFIQFCLCFRKKEKYCLLHLLIQLSAQLMLIRTPLCLMAKPRLGLTGYISHSTFLTFILSKFFLNLLCLGFLLISIEFQRFQGFFHFISLTVVSWVPFSSSSFSFTFICSFFSFFHFYFPTIFFFFFNFLSISSEVATHWWR